MAEREITGSPVCVRFINVDPEPAGLSMDGRITWAEDLVENLRKGGRVHLLGSAYLELAETPEPTC